MSTKARSAVIALTIATSLLAVVPPTSVATFTYPSATCSGTLQECIDNAAAGSTIRIAQNERIDEHLTITKSLTLKNAPGFRPIVGGVNSEADRRMIDVHEVTPAPVKVTIAGIFFKHANVNARFDTGNGHRFTMRDSKILFEIDHNNTDGLNLTAYAPSRFDVFDNRIETTGSGVDFFSDMDGPEEVNVTIVGNRFVGVRTPDQSGSGVSLDLRGSGQVNARIHNNVIYDVAGCNCGSAAGIAVRSEDDINAIVEIVGNTVHSSAICGYRDNP